MKFTPKAIAKSIHCDSVRKFCYMFAMLAIVISLTVNETSFAYMSWNNACLFAGNSSSYISVANSSALNLTGSFTLEAWINQSSSSTSAKGIISKGGSLGSSLRYGLRLTNKRIFLLINGGSRMATKTSTTIEPNTWYHVCAVFNSSTGEHSIYINGVLDSTSTYSSTLPNSNTDSLYVGISGNSSPFNGMLDEVRIWNRALDSVEVAANFRSILATSSGRYEGMVLSLPFQREHSSTAFSTSDFSGTANVTNARNITPVSFANQPSNTVSTNMAVAFDGNEDYLAGKDTSAIEPTGAITIDLWIYPTDFRNCNIVTKGNQYALTQNLNKIGLKINGVSVLSDLVLALSKWNRVTVCSNPTFSRFYLDGTLVSSISAGFGNIASGSDSIFIGGVPGAVSDFEGYLDEVRIQKRFFFSEDSAFVSTFEATDLATDPTSNTEVCYNLDGYLKDNNSNGGPELYFRNNASFNNPGTAEGVAVSPLFRTYDASVQEGFYLPLSNSLNINIPPSGTAGTTLVSIPIHLAEPVSGIEVMLGINHGRLSDLTVDLIAPNGDSARLMSAIEPLGYDNSARIIFSDVADSVVASGRYSSIAGLMKPQNNMISVFGGDDPVGNWTVKITDNVSGESGIVHVCGIRLNNKLAVENNFTFTAFVQGHYNASGNSQSTDTMQIILRNFSNPSIVYDSSKALASGIGRCRFSFANVPYDARCFIQVKHRNSIETWNSTMIIFKKFSASYLMFQNPSLAFGSNLIQVDTSPVTFAIYGGDVNQDRTVDATDVSMIDNDAQNFISGYVSTDLTGDDFVDGTDFAIADNNAANFVSAILP